MVALADATRQVVRQKVYRFNGEKSVTGSPGAGDAVGLVLT